MQKQSTNVEVLSGFAVATRKANAYRPHGGPMHKIKHIRPASPAIASTSSVSFAGCGALNFYQTGVAFALQETGHTGRLHFLGASAGAGLAFTTAAGLDARKVAATMAQWITGYGPGRLLKPAWAFEVATRFGEHFVNRERFEKVLGRLTVSVTEQAPLTNHLISSFSSESVLSEALIASCFIPYPGQWNTTCGTFRAMDGGFTNNQPAIDSGTLRVSPFWFAPRATIRPTFKVHPMQALRVPTESECWWLFNQGFVDAQAWLVKPLSRPRKMGRLSRFPYPQSSKNRAA
ncbi:MAG: hypothetical protein VX210_01555 [Myxococcota bacterium]|nr:hypothetical protein [Myxococcota bacterium]